MDYKEAQELLKKYLAGECSPAEKKRVESWYDEQLLQRDSDTFNYDREDIKAEIWGDIENNRSINRRKIKRLLPTVAAAAAVLIGLFLYLFFEPHHAGKSSIPVQAQVDPVLPGGNKAVLTTEDGRQYVLSDLADGVVEQKDGFTITKQEDGIIAFDATGQAASSAPVYNTIETPKGGVYQVMLPDGSKVWLNSASSISFPSKFDENERVVSVSGEVYFEVERDTQRPFKVKTPQQEIEVLGTSFNIHAYEEEPYAKTTLVQGSVRVKGHAAAQVLTPGYEMVTQGGKDRIVQADISSVLAWKEGVFQFDRVGLDVLMRQLARWYDVELVYVGELPKDEFVGRIKRKEHIAKVLEVLQDGNVDVVLEDRKLIVGQNKKVNQ